MENPQTFSPKPLWLPVLIALILGSSFIYGKKIETRSLDQLTVSVSGEGKVFAAPDIAELNFGVQTGRKKTAKEAMETLAERMTAVIDAVKSAGVEEKDIATQYLSLSPSYDWDEGQRIDRGFEASQNLNVKIRNLDEISSVLSSAALAGANQVGNVNFTIDDPEELRAQAREEAISNAKEKAQKLAGDLGMSLGRLSAFSEGGVFAPMARMEMAVLSEGVGGGGQIAPPIPSGEQEIQVSVNLVYELE